MKPGRTRKPQRWKGNRPGWGTRIWTDGEWSLYAHGRCAFRECDGKWLRLKLIHPKPVPHRANYHLIWSALDHRITPRREVVVIAVAQPHLLPAINAALLDGAADDWITAVLRR